MSDAIYPKTSKASKSPGISKAPVPPVDDYEEYDDEYEEYEEYDEYDEPYNAVAGVRGYEQTNSGLLTTPGRAVALGLSALALLAVFSAVIWLMSTSKPPGPPQLPEGAQGGVPVIQGFVQTSEQQAPTKGAFAPDFMWKDTDNQTVALSSFRGTKPVFVNFWGTWCPPCRQEMPEMEKFYQLHKDQIQMIGVSMYPRDDPTQVLNFVKDANYSWKFIHDGDYKVADKYHVDSVPSSYFIDRNGIIKAVQVGAFLSESQMESYFAQVK
jgi:cytochrome c biogenesis protein CcmG/thiol:disulfide interchange protein DsbE